MIPALKLVADLRRQGVGFRWGERGVHVTGDLGRITPDYRTALRSVKDDLEVLVRWQGLQDESEKRFGHKAARLYPFFSLKLETTPVVRTPLGPARLVQVQPDVSRVVLEAELNDWHQRNHDGRKRGSLPLSATVLNSQIDPPTTPPEFSSEIGVGYESQGD